MRRTDVQRDSKPDSHELFTDRVQKANLEARNGLVQFDEVRNLIAAGIAPAAKFQLRPSTIQRLQRIAIQDIYTCSGNWRTKHITISNTSHDPPPPGDVPQLVEEMCDYVTANWHCSPIHLSAYLMWRVNWIHPFMGGNGRTSRAVSYLVLCVRLGYLLPGTLSIPEQVVANRQPYYAALDAADAAWTGQVTDVTVMETLLSELLAKQLLSVHTAATGSV